MSPTKIEPIKITQTKLSTFIQEEKEKNGSDVFECKQLLESKGYSSDLSGLYIDLSEVDKEINLSDLNLRGSKLYLPLEQEVEFRNSDLTDLEVHRGPNIGMMHFENTKMLNTLMFLGPRNELHRLDKQDGNLIDLVIDRPFYQSDLIARTNMLDTRGVCFGLSLEFARHVMKKQQQGKAEEEIDILEKLSRKTNKRNNIDNFALRVQLYQTNQDKIKPYDISDSDLESGLLKSLPGEISNSNMIGLSFNVFNDNGDVNGHIVVLRKIKSTREGFKYQVLDSSSGISRTLVSEDDVHKHFTALVYQYQKNAPLGADKEIKVWDLEDAVHRLGLLPKDELSDAENKSKKYDIRFDNNQLPPLHSMIGWKSSISVIKKYLEKMGGNVDVRDQNGATPLMYACKIGRDDIAAHLILNGADLEAKDNNGNTALALACKNNQIKTAQFLVKDCSANVDAHIEGVPILSWAAKEGHGQLMKHLLERAETDVDVPDQNGATPLIYACAFGRNDIAAHLILNGAELDTRDNYGDTALTLACKNNQIKTAQFLVKDCSANVDVHIEGVPILSWAAKEGHGQLMKHLLERAETDVDVPDQNGATPLIYAAANGHKNLVEELIKNGAKVNKVDNYGYSALDIARGAGRSEIVELLEAKSAPVLPKPNFVTQQIARLNAIEAAKKIGAGVTVVGGNNIRRVPPPPPRDNGPKIR